jgi:hypothetical protein
MRRARYRNAAIARAALREMEKRALLIGLAKSLGAGELAELVVRI